MDNNPKISIIVPVYNLERFINQCVDSLINQTFKDIEIILVDDGSTDSCPSICDDYQSRDERITVIHQKNMGLSGTRNTGISVSNAKWFMIIDGDDWLEPDAIEFLYKNAEKYNSDMFIASYFANSESNQLKDSFFSENEFHFSSKEEMLNLQVNCIIKNNLAKMKSASNMGSTWARLYRRSIVVDNNLNFIVGLNRTQDAIFNLYLLEYVEKVDFVDVPVQHYRVWNGSASKKYSKDFHVTAGRIAGYIKEFMSATGKSDIFLYAYYSKVTKLIMEIVKLELSPRANKDGFWKKRNLLKKLATSEPYKSAIRYVDSSTLTKGQKLGHKLLKIHCYSILLILYIYKENH